MSSPPPNGDYIYAPGAQGLVTNPTGSVTFTYNQPAIQARPLNLPGPPPGPLVGRSKELAELAALLSPGWLLQSWGMVGVGKSTLALTAARQYRDRFPGGLLYLNLGLYHNRNTKSR